MSRLEIIARLDAYAVHLPEPLLETLADVAQALTHQARDRSAAIDSALEAAIDGTEFVLPDVAQVEALFRETAETAVPGRRTPVQTTPSSDEPSPPPQAHPAPAAVTTPANESAPLAAPLAGYALPPARDDEEGPPSLDIEQIADAEWIGRHPDPSGATFLCVQCRTISAPHHSCRCGQNNDSPAGCPPPAFECGHCDTTIPCACGRNDPVRPWWRPAAPGRAVTTCRDCRHERSDHGHGGHRCKAGGCTCDAFREAKR